MFAGVTGAPADTTRLRDGSCMLFSLPYFPTRLSRAGGGEHVVVTPWFSMASMIAFRVHQGRLCGVHVGNDGGHAKGRVKQGK